MTDMPKITIPVCGGGRKDGYSLTVKGLTQGEHDRLKASLLGGHHWVRRTEDGRLRHVPSYEELPGPTTDDDMLPFWRHPVEGEVQQDELFGFDADTEALLQHSSPSIYISSLCGYHYSVENYKHEADRLTDYGFVCMRSPRDPDTGQYWEKWYLGSVWLTQGRLKEALSDSSAGTGQEKFKFILEYLRRNVAFGSLDVVMQRMAMVISD